MKYFLSLICFCFAMQSSFSQVVNTAVMDTSDFRYQGKVTVEGYIDAYYAYDFNKPQDDNRSYFVSMNRHNEMTINLAFIDVKYSSNRLRARFVPGFGTYINANYAAENGTLKNIVEASAGIKLWSDKNIWIDVGVFGSPYTNESAISKDHLAYTRSFAPEYVPYYLSGLKVSIPIADKLNGYFYLLNGWQQIGDTNKNKSIGTQLEYRPSNNWLVNWNTYVGNENSVTDPFVGTRYFTDVFFIYNKNKWSMTGCAYIGSQEQTNGTASWWTANFIARYDLTDKLSVTGRLEYFADDKGVQVSSVNPVYNFETYSSSLGINVKIAENMLWRTEGRTFFSDKEVYQREGIFVTDSNLITTNLTIWF